MTSAPSERNWRDITVQRVNRLDFRMQDQSWVWSFHEQRRADIAAYFAALQREKPGLWNGRVLLFRDCRIENGVFSGGAFETDYASFMAWRSWNFPDTRISNCFALPAIRGSDGAFVLGRMAAHTANAGEIYFPCGTPDSDDIIDGKVDLDFSARRELLEETGARAEDFTIDDGWSLTRSGGMVALFKGMQAKVTGAELRERMLEFLNAQQNPELDDIVLVRNLADLSPAMPDYLLAFLHDALSSRMTK